MHMEPEVREGAHTFVENQGIMLKMTKTTFFYRKPFFIADQKKFTPHHLQNKYYNPQNTFFDVLGSYMAIFNVFKNESGASKQSGPGSLDLVGDAVRRIREATHTFSPTSSSYPGPDCLLAPLSLNF